MRDPEGYLITIADTPSYRVDAQTRLSDDDEEQLIQYLSLDPEGGRKVEGFDYIRILEWETNEQVNAFIIYLFATREESIFLLSVCDSSEDALSLINDDPAALRELVAHIIGADALQKAATNQPSGSAA